MKFHIIHFKTVIVRIEPQYSQSTEKFKRTDSKFAIEISLFKLPKTEDSILPF